MKVDTLTTPVFNNPLNGRVNQVNAKAALLHKILLFAGVAFVIQSASAIAQPAMYGAANRNQFSNKQTTFVGFRFGKSFSNLQSEPTFTEKPTTMNNVMPGIFLLMDSRKMLGVAFTLDYVRKGANLVEIFMTDESGNSFGTSIVSYRFSYLELSSLLRIKLPNNKTVRPFVAIGPYVSRLIKADFGIEDLPEDFPAPDTDIRDQMKSLDYGLTIGGGLDMQAFESAVLFDITYSFGLADAFKNSVFSGNQTLHCLKVGIGIGF